MVNVIKSILNKIILVVKILLKSNVKYSIRGSNNIIEVNGNLSNVTFDIVGNNIKVIINKSVINNALIYIRGDGHNIYIGDNCYLGEGELWLEDNNCSLIIHDNTTIEKGHLAVTEPYSKITIHKDCMLAKHVEIRTGDSHSIIDVNSGDRINKAADVVLEEHVWVGAHAKILKGVTIGHNSVVGTASVVVKNVPTNSIAAGIPASVVRSNIDWKRERI